MVVGLEDKEMAEEDLEAEDLAEEEMVGEG